MDNNSAYFIGFLLRLNTSNNVECLGRGLVHSKLSRVFESSFFYYTINKVIRLIAFFDKIFKNNMWYLRRPEKEAINGNVNRTAKKSTSGLAELHYVKSKIFMGMSDLSRHMCYQKGSITVSTQFSN